MLQNLPKPFDLSASSQKVLERQMKLLQQQQHVFCNHNSAKQAQNAIRIIKDSVLKLLKILID